MKIHETRRAHELYRVSLHVGRGVILVSAHGTSGRVETPVTAQLTHMLLFILFSGRKLSIYPHTMSSLIHAVETDGNVAHLAIIV